jgi:hypothetical protein
MDAVVGGRWLRVTRAKPSRCGDNNQTRSGAPAPRRRVNKAQTVRQYSAAPLDVQKPGYWRVGITEHHH